LIKYNSFFLLAISFFLGFNYLTTFLLSSLFFFILTYNRESFFILLSSIFLFFLFDNVTDLKVAISLVSFPLFLTLIFSVINKKLKFTFYYEYLFIFSINVIYFSFPEITLSLYLFILDNF
jgi:hypothetical protein